MSGRHHIMSRESSNSTGVRNSHMGLENTGFLRGKLAVVHTATTWVSFAEAAFYCQ